MGQETCTILFPQIGMGAIPCDMAYRHQCEEMLLNMSMPEFYNRVFCARTGFVPKHDRVNETSYGCEDLVFVEDSFCQCSGIHGYYGDRCQFRSVEGYALEVYEAVTAGMAALESFRLGWLIVSLLYTKKRGASTSLATDATSKMAASTRRLLKFAGLFFVCQVANTFWIVSLSAPHGEVVTGVSGTLASITIAVGVGQSGVRIINSVIGGQHKGKESTSKLRRVLRTADRMENVVMVSNMIYAPISGILYGLRMLTVLSLMWMIQMLSMVLLFWAGVWQLEKRIMALAFESNTQSNGESKVAQRPCERSIRGHVSAPDSEGQVAIGVAAHLQHDANRAFLKKLAPARRKLRLLTTSTLLMITFTVTYSVISTKETYRNKSLMQWSITTGQLLLVVLSRLSVQSPPSRSGRKVRVKPSLTVQMSTDCGTLTS